MVKDIVLVVLGFLIGFLSMVGLVVWAMLTDPEAVEYGAIESANPKIKITYNIEAL